MLELAVRLVVSLAVVVGLLMLLARLGAKKFRGSSDALVTVVHRQALSRTSAVSVVTVGNRVLVLGTTEQQVSVLAELDPEDLDPETAAEPVGQFADALETAQGQFQVAAPVEAQAPAAPPRPQARPASKAPAWDPNAALRSLPAVRAPKAPGAPSAPTAPSAAVDAILAAVDAHNARTPIPPALAILDDETASEPRRLTLAPQVQIDAPGRLAGSVLSPQTWKQALAAVTSRRAS